MLIFTDKTEDTMVIMITGASHTGKTLLAQRMLEKYNISRNRMRLDNAAGKTTAEYYGAADRESNTPVDRKPPEGIQA